jgi:hypothetical protein
VVQSISRLVVAVTALTIAMLLSPRGPSRLDAAGSARAPKIRVSSIVYRRAAGTVDLHVRLCLSNGPGAKLSVIEQRAVHGAPRATARWADPTGVDLKHVYPYGCVSDYQIAWVLEPRLLGPGTYTATIRVRDGYGTWSGPVFFRISSP